MASKPSTAHNPCPPNFPSKSEVTKEGSILMPSPGETSFFFFRKVTPFWAAAELWCLICHS